MLVTRQKVLRRFWYPVIPADRLADTPVPFTLLGTRLVLFRDAAGRATARALVGHVSVRRPTRSTATVDAARPAKESSQNGSTSQIELLGPRRPQTHRRLNTYDGPMPHNTAITLASPAAIPDPTVSVTRTVALSTVVPTETDRQRAARCASCLIGRRRSRRNARL